MENKDDKIFLLDWLIDGKFLEKGNSGYLKVKVEK